MKIFCIAILCFLFTATQASGQSQNQVGANNPDEHKKKAYYNQLGSEVSPFIVKILPSSPVNNTVADDAESHNQEFSQWGNYSERLLALFTFLLFIYTAFLWRSTSRLVKDARGSSERELQAYVYYELPRIRPWPEKGSNRYSVIIDVVNSGKTWAKNVSCRKALFSLPRSDTRDPFNAIVWSQESIPMLLGPNQKVDLSLGDIPFTDIPAIINGDIIWYIICIMTYEDVIHEPPWTHEVHMFRRFNHDNEGGYSTSGMPTHNYALERQPGINNLPFWKKWFR